MTTKTPNQPYLTAALAALLNRSGVQVPGLAEQLTQTALSSIELWTLTYTWKTDHDNDEDHGGVFGDHAEAQKAAAGMLADRLSSVIHRGDEESPLSERIQALITQGAYGEALAAFDESDLHSLIDWTYQIDRTELNKAL